MSLNTFGAVMNFTAEIFRRSADFYRTAASKARDPKLRESLHGLQKEAEKHQSLMEQIRRENVTEMILEPVSGLAAEEFRGIPQLRENALDGDFLRAAVEIESGQQIFLAQASARVCLPEAARAFRKISDKKKTNLACLLSLKIG
jgi:hypothetical protein